MYSTGYSLGSLFTARLVCGSVQAKFGGDPHFLAQVPRDEFAEFAAAAGCEPTSIDTLLGTEVIRHDYVGCDDGTLRVHKGARCPPG